MPLQFFKNLYGRSFIKNNDKLFQIFDWISTKAKLFDVIEIHAGKLILKFTFSESFIPDNWILSLKLISIEKRDFYKENDSAFVVVLRNVFKPKSNYVKLFNSEIISVYEFGNRFSKKNSPIRFGVNENERQAMVGIVKNVLMGERLEKGAVFGIEENFPRLLQEGVVCVALWQGGILKGSYISKEWQISKAIFNAAINCLKDSRFTPIDFSDVESVSIEITIINDFGLKFKKEDLINDSIYPNKAYKVVGKDRSGWLVPEVYNVRNFNSHSQLISMLCVEKAGISVNDLESIVLYEIESFVFHNKKIFILESSMLKPDYFSKEKLIESRDLAIDFLMNNVVLKNEIPAIWGRFARGFGRQNWPRISFTALAVAECNRIRNDKRLLDISQFIIEKTNQALVDKNFSLEDRLLIEIYLGNALLSLGKVDQARIKCFYVASNLLNTKISFILYGQAISLLVNYKKITGRSDFEKICNLISDKIISKFKQEVGDRAVSLASIASMYDAFNHDSRYKSLLKLLREIFVNNQYDSGYFKNTPESNYVYSRGTGKMVEVLAYDVLKNKKEIESGLMWLISMQYKESNSYCLSSDLTGQIYGGIRHDYCNGDVWIDAVGHFLLASTRYLVTEKS
jgi:hypothetical protein